MSRWLWALLGGVVLVAIAALFWTAGNQTNVTPPVSPGPTAVVPAPAPAPPASAPVAQKPAPPPPPALALPTEQEAASPPAPSPTAPPAPTVAPDAGQQAATPPAPPPSRETPRLRQSLRRSPRLRPSPKRPCRRPRPAGRRRKFRTYMRPRASRSWSGPGPIPRRIAGGCSSGAAAAGRIASRWTSSPRPRLSSSTKKILLPSAICRIEGASEAEGALKVSADCEDSISYTSRSVMIALRSATELVYSASGDPALATTLKKCAP